MSQAATAEASLSTQAGGRERVEAQNCARAALRAEIRSAYMLNLVNLVLLTELLLHSVGTDPQHRVMAFLAGGAAFLAALISGATMVALCRRTIIG